MLAFHRNARYAAGSESGSAERGRSIWDASLGGEGAMLESSHIVTFAATTDLRRGASLL